jgi:hypothetical protein
MRGQVARVHGKFETYPWDIVLFQLQATRDRGCARIGAADVGGRRLVFYEMRRLNEALELLLGRQRGFGAREHFTEHLAKDLRK